MLVLSRGHNEKIVFPRLAISIEVVQIARNRVRLGVKAPRDITVLREELAPAGLGEEGEGSVVARPKLSHDLRNRLHTAHLALRLAQRLLSRDQAEEAEATLERALHEFSAVEQRLEEEFPGETQPRRALVVDDNANEGQLLAAYLRACGYQVETASDGRDAMRKLDQLDGLDVLLLDMAMPHCDGPSMLRTLRRDTRFDDLTIFAVTGSEPERFTSNRACRRVNQWFQKPVDAETLVQEMNRVLQPSVAGVN